MRLLTLVSLLVGAIQLRLTAAVTISQWQITQYYVEILTTSVGRFATSLTFTDTTTLYLYPPVPSSIVPTASATSTSVSTDTYYNAQSTFLYVPATAIPSAQLSAITSYVSSSSLFRGTSTYTSFIVNKVYTAPASCKSSFQFTTTSALNVPRGAETQLPSPTSQSTSFGVYTYITAYMPSDLVYPTATTSTPDFVQSYYVNSCSTPYGAGSRTALASATGTAYSGGSGQYSGGNDPYYNNYNDEICLGSLCPFWLIYIIVIIPFLALLFLGGLIESYYWFSRLMKGRFAFRGVPLLWICISLWTLLCLRRQRPADQQHRAQLEKQWREMSTGTHLRLWFKYGFRHRDPPELTKIIGTTAPGAPIWGPYNHPQQAPYQSPPGQGPPPPGQGPPMQPYPQYYQHPQQWQQGQTPPPGWTGYPPPQGQYAPPPGHPYPPQGYAYGPPPPQQPQAGQDKSLATESTSPEVVSSTPTPAPAAQDAIGGHTEKSEQQPQAAVTEGLEHGGQNEKSEKPST